MVTRPRRWWILLGFYRISLCSGSRLPAMKSLPLLSFSPARNYLFPSQHHPTPITTFQFSWSFQLMQTLRERTVGVHRNVPKLQSAEYLYKYLQLQSNVLKEKCSLLGRIKL